MVQEEDEARKRKEGKSRSYSMRRIGHPFFKNATLEQVSPYPQTLILTPPPLTLTPHLTLSLNRTLTKTPRSMW